MRRLDQVQVSPDDVWRGKLLRRLHYHFGQDFGAAYEPNRLCEINIRSIKLLRQALDIKVPMIRSSSLSCSGAKSERLAQICEAVGGDTYLCGSGGVSYIDPHAFRKISVEYFHEQVPDYLSTLCHLSPKQLAHGLSSLACST